VSRLRCRRVLPGPTRLRGAVLRSAPPVEHCFECAESPCPRYDGVDTVDSFITHRRQLADLSVAKRQGVDACLAILKRLLADFDDGRRKSFHYQVVNLLGLPDIQSVMGTLLNAADYQATVDVRAATAADCSQ